MEITRECIAVQTIQHNFDVRNLLYIRGLLAEFKAMTHDHSKIKFIETLWAALNEKELGDKFNGSMERWKEIHSNEEDHHLQWKVKGTETLYDVCEMLADWVAASARRNTILNPSITRLPNLNFTVIMRNTLAEFVGLWGRVENIKDELHRPGEKDSKIIADLSSVNLEETACECISNRVISFKEVKEFADYLDDLLDERREIIKWHKNQKDSVFEDLVLSSDSHCDFQIEVIYSSSVDKEVAKMRRDEFASKEGIMLKKFTHLMAKKVGIGSMSAYYDGYYAQTISYVICSYDQDSYHDPEKVGFLDEDDLLHNCDNLSTLNGNL